MWFNRKLGDMKFLPRWIDLWWVQQTNKNRFLSASGVITTMWFWYGKIPIFSSILNGEYIRSEFHYETMRNQALYDLFLGITEHKITRIYLKNIYRSKFLITAFTKPLQLSPIYILSVKILICTAAQILHLMLATTFAIYYWTSSNYMQTA